MKWDGIDSFSKEEDKDTYNKLIEKIDENIRDDIKNREDELEKMIKKMNSLIYTSLWKFKKVEFRITTKNRKPDSLELAVIEYDISKRYSTSVALKKFIERDRIKMNEIMGDKNNKITTLIWKIEL